MSKPNRRRVVMQQVRQKYAEAVGGEEVEIELADGHTVTVPHPLFAPDDWKDRFDAADNDHDRAVAALGDQYEDFRKHGGDDNDLNLVLIDLQHEMRDVLRSGGKPVPTTSSTSSETTQKPSKRT